MNRYLSLLALVLAHLLIRAPIWGRLGFINADSAIFLRYDFVVLSNRLPLYPILIDMMRWFIPHDMIAGQLVASLGFGLAAVALVVVGRELAGGPSAHLAKSAGWLTALLFTVSPFAWANGASVLSEGPFIALVCGCLAAFLVQRRTGGPLAFFFCLFFAGLAPLVRAEGWICLLPALLAIGRALRGKMSWSDGLLGLCGLLGFVPVLVWYGLIAPTAGYFAELGGGAAEGDLNKFISFFWRYLLFLPLVALPQVAYAALGPGSRGLRAKQPGADKLAEGLLILLVPAWLVALSVHWAWDVRFLLGPSAILAALAGPGFIRWWTGGRKRLVIILLSSTVVLGTALFYPLSQPLKNMGQEVRRVSQCAQKLAGDAEVWSTEIASTSYYLDRLVLPLDPARVRPGDLVLLHDMFGGAQEKQEQLADRFAMKEVCFASRKLDQPPPASARDIFRPDADRANVVDEGKKIWILESRALLITDYRR